jgi:hypothetical glycosyl hydrolase
MFRYDELHPSILNDDDFSFGTQNIKESVMTCGNGLFGLRGTYEEKIPYEKRGFFCADAYCIAGDYKEELVNLPDISEIQIMIDGERVHLLTNNILENSRTLNLLCGELKRKVIWKSRDNQITEIILSRVFSKKNPHLLMQYIEINPKDKNIQVELKIGINGEVTNQGHMHLGQMKKRVIENRIISAQIPLCIEPLKRINILMGLKQDHSWLKGSYQPYQKRIEGTYHFEVIAKKPLILSKINLISINDFEEETIHRYIDVPFTYSSVLEENYQHPMQNYLSIVTNQPTKTKIEATLYHMNIMTPITSNGSIGAKGLSGEGYRGHIFWDTEIFMFPIYLLTNPSIAKAILMYRYERLNISREIAKSKGFSGAIVPWESAQSGRDQTPEYSAINIHTGEQTKIMSGEKELHVTLAVMYAICQYAILTADQEFMFKFGIEMLEEYTKFWLSRASKTLRGYEIIDVIGPDEYTESINNNYYTNYLLKKCLTLSIPFYTNQAMIEQVLDFIPNIYLPPTVGHIIPQDDTFLSKPIINIDKYRENAGSQAILKDYSREEVIELQVLKQADTVMLFELFPDDFDTETKSVSYEYYEAKTIHDSSLSKATHAIVAFDLNQRKLAEQYFLDSLEIDFCEKSHSDNGIHAASMYRPFWILFRGVLGGRLTHDNLLKIAPKRQSVVSRFTMKIHCFGRLIQFDYDNNLTITLMEGQAISILVNDISILIKDSHVVPIEDI